MSKGLEKIQCFIRWGKHQDLKIYADALEEWDEGVGDSKWDELDDTKNLALNPTSWLSEQEFFRNKEINVDKIIDSAYKKADVFLARF